ncbi:ferritin light chain-like [Perognathus longimembris pacificus]|uniref:ferritin light chain-like n=1 Tax=Perognathus longimembris pacificus TaxID=214514 RepID=UPI002019733C|nr:ferritin light chain-like [Perognathus longimembris pacificus]
MSVLSLPSYIAEVEAAIDHLITLCLQASDMYLSLGFYFQDDSMVLQSICNFFQNLAEKKRKDAYYLLRKNPCSGGGYFPVGQLLPQDGWHDITDAMESSLTLEMNLYQALGDLYALGLASRNIQLCKFLKRHFLGKEVKLMKKINKRLTTLRRQMGLDAELS